MIGIVFILEKCWNGMGGYFKLRQSIVRLVDELSPVTQGNAGNDIIW